MIVTWKHKGLKDFFLTGSKKGITPDIAFRLARVFNSTPPMWLNMQQALDLWEIEASHGDEYRNIHPVQDSSSPSTTP